MTNGEKYKTAEERTEAMSEYCDEKSCEDCPLIEIDGDKSMACSFHWLELEAEEEKPLPCPFCGGVCKTFELILENGHYVICDKCRYASAKASTDYEAIAAHNRVAKAVNESEVTHERQWQN